MQSLGTDSGMQTLRPRRTKVIRPSSMRRRGNRSLVLSRSATSATVSRRSIGPPGSMAHPLSCRGTLALCLGFELGHAGAPSLAFGHGAQETDGRRGHVGVGGSGEDALPVDLDAEADHVQRFGR